MARYIRLNPRTAPYMPIAATASDGAPIAPNRQRRHRVQFEMDVERNRYATTDPLGELKRHMQKSIPGLQGVKIFTDGNPLRRNDQPQVAIGLETVPSRGQRWFIGGWNEIVGVRVTGMGKEMKDFARVRTLVQAIYNLMLERWNVELT